MTKITNNSILLTYQSLDQLKRKRMNPTKNLISQLKQFQNPGNINIDKNVQQIEVQVLRNENQNLQNNEIAVVQEPRIF